MDRLEVIQKIINHKNATNYLEIGVFTGKCFLNIKAKRKFAVDPDFRIPWEIRKDNLCKRIKRYYFNSFETYFKKGSDEFFSEEVETLQKHLLDVVFIDGLHTYEQTIKDVKNSLNFLKEDGVIILHDCNPESETIAYPAKSLNDAESLNLPEWTGVWSGDVWKTIVDLKTNREDLTTFVLNTDCGLGIVTKKPSSKIKISNDMSISKLTYNELNKNRQNWLDLKSIEFFDTFINSL